MRSLAGYVNFAEWSGNVATLLTRYRNENEALQQMLLETGMTRARIRRGVRRRVKYLQSHEEASVLFHRVCEQIQQRLREEDPLEQLAKTLPKKETKQMS